MTPTARCKRCGALIGFAYTVTGKRMPIDPEPVADGNVYIDDLLAPFPRAVVVSKANPTPEGVAHLSHFASCIAAAEFRRKQ